MQGLIRYLNTFLKPGFAGAALIGLACSGCTTDMKPAELLRIPAQFNKPPAPPPPTPQAPHDDTERFEDAIRAEQVVPDAADDPVPTTESRLNQIPEDPESANRLRSAIETDDPCFGDLAKTERCQSGLTPASETSQDGRGTGNSLTIIAPGSTAITDFDPARAVNEIGRGKTLSQAAQSAGSNFLSGDPTRRPAQPMEEDELPAGATVEGLPASVLVPDGSQ